MNTEQLKQLENTLWQTADTLRANSDLKSSEYSTPVLGIIFLKFADNKYSQFEDQIIKEHKKLKGTRREKPLSEIAIEKCGFYLHAKSRYDYLLKLPEKEDIAKALKDAMESMEKYKPELKGVLPKDEYFRLVRKPEYRIIPKQLLKNFADIPKNASGGMFVQSAKFIEERHASNGAQKNKRDTSLFVYGQEKTQETVKLAKMNIAEIAGE